MNAALQAFGLTPFFANQLAPEEREAARLGRVTQVQRSVLRAFDGAQELTVALPADYHSAPPQNRPTVGDWVVLDAAHSKVERVLERKSAFQRVAAGEKTQIQLIAANVDILFVVTSCNEEFRESRLERYLALAAEAGVMPVVVLTKVDLAEDADAYIARARRVQPGLAVVSVNALDASSFGDLSAWIEPASTVALVGSSGVGKSTILNTLMAASVAKTAAIREDDKKGRHTTSHRALHVLPGGGLLIDVPGMRELRVAGLDEGLAAVFEDIETLAQRCRFPDCRHDSEPGCAVQAAVGDGSLSERRFENYRKLVRENRRNTETLAETRRHERAFGRIVKDAVAWKKGLKS